MFAHVRIDLVLLVAYVLASLTGLHLLKTSAGSVLSGSFVAGLGCYATGFMLWYLMLTKLPLSTAFPLAAGALIVGTQLLGHTLLGEALGPRQVLGVVLIVVGIAAVFPRGA